MTAQMTINPKTMQLDPPSAVSQHRPSAPLDSSVSTDDEELVPPPKLQDSVGVPFLSPAFSSQTDNKTIQYPKQPSTLTPNTADSAPKKPPMASSTQESKQLQDLVHEGDQDQYEEQSDKERATDPPGHDSA